MLIDRYYAEVYPPLRGWAIRDRLADSHPVDVVRSPRSARAAVDLLNADQAHVDAHGVLGCRIVLDARQEAA